MFGGARISPRLWARKPLGALALLLLAIVLALPRAALAQTVTIIVDNLDPNTVVTGTWSQSSGPNPWEANSVYSNGGGSTFRWLPAVPVAGVYEVYAWWTYHNNRSTTVPYRIGHAGGVDTVVVNQHDTALGGQWNLLGSYTFDAGSGGYVEVSAENGQASADAVRLREIDPAVIGQWDSAFDFPAVPVHSIMLHTGKVLMFRGDGSVDESAGVPTTYTWDPLTGQINAQDPGANLFCVGQSILPDGQVLSTGGDIGGPHNGPIYVNIFDPVTETWSPAPDMRDGRFYPTNVALGDGTTLIFSGRDQDGVMNPEVERFIPGGGPGGSDIIEYLEGADKIHSNEQYPYMHLLPSGLVLKVGPSPETYTLDPLTHLWQFVAESNYGMRFDATSVMLPPGHERFMILGGYDPDDPSPAATNTVEIIDISEPSPTWSYTTPMNYARTHPDVVILPDGKVLVVGGSKDTRRHGIPALIPEMFDPETETWTEMAAQRLYRYYHSSAVLLPDGRVLSAGADRNLTAEIYSPPYLFQGPGPIIDAAPESVGYGEPFLVETLEAANIASVVFIRPSATTHSVNMEQRYVLLSFTQVDSATLEVTAPLESNIAPPGYYMLFILDGNSIPSEALFVSLGGNLPLP